MTLKLNVRFINTNAHTKFQLNTLKNVGEKCGRRLGESEARKDNVL